MLQRLNSFLLDELGKGRNVALLIDEAQDLDYSVLEDLRLLSNLETAKEKILQIVLSGQPELGQKLGNPGLRQLRQRVAVSCRLLPLTREELTEYIQSRLTAAGAADPKLFTRDAEERIFEISTGIPRLVNIVCDNALVIGYALGKKRIGADVVNEAAADLVTAETRGCGRPADVPVAAAVGERRRAARRLSQIGVIAVVVLALVIGLLSVGRSLLRRGCGWTRACPGAARSRSRSCSPGGATIRTHAAGARRLRMPLRRCPAAATQTPRLRRRLAPAAAAAPAEHLVAADVPAALSDPPANASVQLAPAPDRAAGAPPQAAPAALAPPAVVAPRRGGGAGRGCAGGSHRSLRHRHFHRALGHRSWSLRPLR